MRYLLIVLSGLVLAALAGVTAEATKMTPPSYVSSCANVRCGFGNSCIETPGGPVCQQQTVSCANVLCAQGNQCIETSRGPQCVPAQPSYPSQPTYPTPPSYNHGQSCAYGGYYHYGRLICYPPPAWRTPYQYGWGQYYNPPPRYTPPRPTPKPRPRPPWHPDGPDVVEPGPRMCTMQYDPVCAERPVVCVRSPCLPDRKTFGNSCMAKNDGYTVLYKGTCN